MTKAAIFEVDGTLVDSVDCTRERVAGGAGRGNATLHGFRGRRTGKRYATNGSRPLLVRYDVGDDSDP